VDSKNQFAIQQAGIKHQQGQPFTVVLPKPHEPQAFAAPLEPAPTGFFVFLSGKALAAGGLKKPVRNSAGWHKAPARPAIYSCPAQAS
jgi:hypothetical protein